MENNIFSIRRFALVAKKDMQENWKSNLIYTLLMFGVLFSILLFTSYNDYDSIARGHYFYSGNRNKDYVGYTILMFLMFFTIYTSLMMKPMSSKNERAHYLMVPASSFEKYLCRWLQVTIGFVVVFMLCFLLADFLRVAICTVRFPGVDVRPISFEGVIWDGKNRSALFFNKTFFINCVSYFILTLSFFALGSTFFEKNTFVKTFVAYILVVGALSISINKLGDVLLPSSASWSIFENPMQSFDPTNSGSIVFVCLIMSIFFWVLAYFRFKESEIIHKW